MTKYTAHMQLVVVRNNYIKYFHFSKFNHYNNQLKYVQLSSYNNVYNFVIILTVILLFRPI